MSVIVAETATSLSTANGFYRSEAYNVGCFTPNGVIQLNTARTIAVTFANTGNCRGTVISLRADAATGMKSVTVKLQENVLGVWTDRATATLTAAQITNGVANMTGPCWFVPFLFGTPYAITTAGATWRFEISNAAGTTDWYINTSDNTNPFYISWCDTTVTASSGNDFLCVAAPVTVDMSFTTKAYLGTGDTTRGVSIVICKGSTGAIASVANLQCLTPAASYTLSIDGVCLVGCHSGIRYGTSSVRIPFAQMQTIDFITPTVGSGSSVGFTDYEVSGAFSYYCKKMSFFFYGEIPTVESTTLNGDANSGQPNIVTNVATGWPSGAKVFVGKQDTTGQGDLTIYTTNTVVTTAIGFTGNLASNKRKSGGKVVRMDGYGIKMKVSAASGAVFHSPRQCSNFTISGVQMERMSWYLSTVAGSDPGDDVANSSSFLIEHMSTYKSYDAGIFYFVDNKNGITVQYINSVEASPWMVSPYAPPAYPFTASYCTSLSSNQSPTLCNGSANINYCVFENGNGTILTEGGAGNTISYNSYWGLNQSRVVQRTNMINSTIRGCTYNKCSGNSAGTICLFGNNIGVVEYDAQFGNEAANSIDISLLSAGQYTDYEFSNATSDNAFVNSVGCSTWLLYVPQMPSGSSIRFSNFNGTSNDDRCYLPSGFFRRTGYGLADTKVWSGTAFAAAIAGQFAMRYESSSAVNALSNSWEYKTGNIQNLTTTVAVRLKINSANYYSGTYVLPKLTVNFDNGTSISVTAVATTADQQLLVAFTPLTTFGKYTITLTTQTDQTGSNAYVYWGEVLPSRPNGIFVDTTKFGSWASALPLDFDRTFPAPSSGWDELLASHVIAGSTGEALAQAKTEILNLPAINN